ncbi:hypothetical protein FLAG1_06500 [Fusarium langsethiae]|uniref:Uncharacterized protein n=1 Tax=Fusarium langsethiae TaxID=179993 RepID=A0A0M9EV95_FUSLA|nr:hypothetical protein FLAG1_06500 [Fusarium langsethiae]GKU07465.1 unnamed protein product [Fusarium langsethiae]GKU21219.1 unnamed protein product [Fusarium langsethiae]
MQIAGKSIEDLIGDPMGAFKDLTYEDILDVCESADPDIEATWNGNAGRCTATSLKVADRLTRKYPGQYSFEYFTVAYGAGHRFSRCAKTGIVIDLLSNIGAFVLQPGETKTITTNVTLSWTLAQGKLCLTDQNGTELQCEKVSHARAQALCLYEVACSGQLVVVFRDLNPQFLNQLEFGNEYKPAMFAHGLIKWRLEPDRLEDGLIVSGIKELHLRPNMDRLEQKTIIKWSHANSPDYSDVVYDEVHRFLRTCTGPFGNQQWAAGEISEFLTQMWRKVCYAYGKPRVTVWAAAG